MENEGTEGTEGNEATPAETLANEVAADVQAESGGVTAEEVANLLDLPVPEASEDAEKKDEKDSEEAADEETNIEDAGADGAGDGDDSADEDAEDDGDGEEEQQEQVDEKQFALEVEDANGKKFTLKPGDDLENALADFEPKSNGQIMKILDDFRKLGDEKAKYDADQETQAAEAEKQQKITNIRSGWDKEIERLQGDKRLPVEADGKVSERVKEVFNFMTAENEKRIAEGRPLLESFEDALDKIELKESKDSAIQKDKEEKELARKRGAIVGGSSAPASSGTSNYTRGSARTATEALRVQGIL